MLNNPNPKLMRACVQNSKKVNFAVKVMVKIYLTVMVKAIKSFVVRVWGKDVHWIICKC